MTNHLHIVLGHSWYGYSLVLSPGSPKYMGTVSKTLVYGLPCFWISATQRQNLWDSGWKGTQKKASLNPGLKSNFSGSQDLC